MTAESKNINLIDQLTCALWIGRDKQTDLDSAPLFRRQFRIERQVASATLHICGLGWYEARLNGQKIGDRVLDPAQTDYEVRCFYVSHDVTALLKDGENVLGVMLGDGWFNQNMVWADRIGHSCAYGEPRLAAVLMIDFEDGTCEVLRTDESWRCAPGPIIRNNVYAGEIYDARMEKRGWDSPGFDDFEWGQVSIMPSPGGALEPQLVEPERGTEEIRSVSIKSLDGGRKIIDFGQNISGWARIRVNAPEGTEIRMRFSEALGSDGELDTASTGVFATKVEQTDVYICRGGDETWEPRFTYHGFRYVEISGWPGEPKSDEITGVVVHTDLKRAGDFECSDERLNMLHRMAVWTHRGNIHAIPTDCPARERCGWLGDANVVCEYSIYNFHAERFWEKYLGDIETSRRLNKDGLPFNIAPGKRRCGVARPDWMAAFIMIPWNLYVYYGNREVLTRHWDGMRTALSHFHAKSENWILAGGFGDWCDPRESTHPTYTPEELTTTAWFAECSRIMVSIAGLLEKEYERDEYAQWHEAIAEAFRLRFYDSNKRTFGSQTADAMALHFGLAPSGAEDEIVNSLVRDIRETHHCHHSVGIFGLRYLFEVLTRRGHGKLALNLMHQDTYPSFGDIIRRGATTLWEYWGEPEIDAKGPRSLSHPMMGGFDNWFFNTIAGIRPDENNPGFQHFYLEPHPIEGMDYARAYHDSRYGKIESAWRIEDGCFVWQVTVPPGTCATAMLPYSGREITLEAGSNILLKDFHK